MKKLLCSLFCVLLAAVLSIAACAQDTGKSNVASDLLPDLSMGSGLSLQSDSADLDAAYTGLYNGLKSYSDFSRNKPVIVTVPSGFTEDDISALYFNVLYEHPELFWFSSAVGFSYSTRTIGSVTYCNYYPVFMPDFNTSALLTPAQEAFSAALAQAKSECFPGGDASKMPVVERLLSVHDWVISHCQYDRLIANSQSGESKNVYTAYGVLVDGNAVCQGYSLAVNLLLNGDSPQSASDFISYSVTSTALNHMWNIVKIGDSWYHFDATFDDPVYSLGSGSSEYYDLPGAASHEHFLLSTAEITAKESGRSDFAGRYGYACTASYTGSKPWAGCRMPFCFDDASDAMIYVTASRNGTSSVGSCTFSSSGASSAATMYTLPYYAISSAYSADFTQLYFLPGSGRDVYECDLSTGETEKLCSYSTSYSGPSGLLLDGNTLYVRQDYTNIASYSFPQTAETSSTPTPAAMTTTSGSDVTISYDASLAPSGLAGSSVTLGNTTSQDVSATCVVAYYSNGRLLNCEVQTVQISANGTATVVINGNSSAVTAKILVMNGSDSVPNTCVVYGA